MADKRLADFVVELAGEGAALVLLRAQEPRGELLQIGAGAGVLIQAAFQLALETEGVADGQKRQHQAAGQRDSKGDD